MRQWLPFVPMFLMYVSFLTLQSSGFTIMGKNTNGIATESGPIGEWWFIPDYRLPGRASEIPSIGKKPIVGPTVQVSSLPIRFHSQLPTERHLDLLDTNPVEPKTLPFAEFSVEMWSMYHVDQPGGSLDRRSI